MKKIYKKLLQKALRNIIKGESIVKRDIKNKKIKEQLFWLCLIRFISHSKAIILLCDKKHNLEALMLLRPLIELTVNMCWALQKKTNLEKFMQHTEYEFENGMPKMGKKWTIELDKRMATIGFSKQYYDSVVKKLHNVLHSNPTEIARSHRKNITAMNSESIFVIAAQFSGQLLKTANALYPKGPFMKSNDIIQKIKGEK